MTEMLEMPHVSACAVSECGFNHGGCHAYAITISLDHSHCATFLDTSQKGGLDEVTAQVGACQRTDCRHNALFECTAPAIRVGPGGGVADCQTFQLNI